MQAPSIPMIDLRPLRTQADAGEALSLDVPEVAECVSQIAKALQEVGFLYVTQHGVAQSLQEQLVSFSRAFFALPEAQKQALRMEEGGLSWRGFFSVGAELTSGRPDRKEGLYLGTEDPLSSPPLPMHGPNQWPSQAFTGLDGVAFQSCVSAYMEAMSGLGRLLMEAIALGLGLSGDYFERRFGDAPTQLFRIFHYPPHEWPEEADEWGVRQHTDMGFLTILKQDQSGGLQVRAREGQWLDAPPLDDTFLINIGDMLELWTWGILKANLHRVKNRARAGRLSFPYFFDPHWHGTLERIDRSLLDPALLAEASSGAEARWDGLDLHRLSEETTYGAFVWSKVKHVFPQLVPEGYEYP